MKTVHISDMTLSFSRGLSFKEKIEIARKLDQLKVDCIHMPKIENVKTDSLLIRTVSSFAEHSVLAVEVGTTAEEVKTAAAAISGAKHGRLIVRLFVSPVQMEYTYHKKAPKMLALMQELFAAACAAADDVEFFAEDATRAEPRFLSDAVAAAAACGVKSVTLCDNEGVLLPDEFSAFVASVKRDIPALAGLRTAILCKDTNGMATASAAMALRAGADEVKCAVGQSEIPALATFAGILERSGSRLGFVSGINQNELYRLTRQIEWIVSKGASASPSASAVATANESGRLYDKNDTEETVAQAVRMLGYDLSPEDMTAVYEEFCRVADKKKTVTEKDIDAVVASVALAVAPTYNMESYVINNGNVIASSAQITLRNGDELLSGIAMGDGPIDAAFRTLEQIIGTHYELDDFQIQSVTEGREAVGQAVVRLRSDGKLYSGNGISTDIIGASIRAYLNAVNKIVYEENVKQ